MTETELTREVCRRVERAGGFTYPLIGGIWSPSSWPDRLIGYKGVWWLVEFKREGRNWRFGKGQKELIGGMREGGLPVFVWCVNEEFRVSVRDEQRRVLFFGDLNSVIGWTLDEIGLEIR